MNRPKLKIPEIKDKTQFIETVKSALIVLLLISALLLLGQTGLFSGLDSNVLGGFFRNDVGSDSVSVGYTAAASPFCIVVSPENGSHCTITHDGEEIAATYNRFSASLGEALGSSGTPKAVSEEEWESALSGCGVYFDFLSDQPVSVLAGWLGTDVSGGAAVHTARRICLAQDGSGVALYYIRAREGTAYRCDTALSYSAISAKVAEYLPDGSAFNFELEQPFDLVDRYAVIQSGQTDVVSVTAENPTTGGVDDEAVLSALGMNSFLASQYPETDGTEVYVEGDNTLRIDTTGIITFTGARGPDTSASLTPAQAIEFARVICEKTLGKTSGEASLYLSYIGYDSATDAYSIRFDYALDGLPVCFSDGNSAAEITLTGSDVTSARLILREYTNAGTTEKPLPSLQAAAVVQAAGGGEPVLAYTDDLKSVTACWLIK